MNPLRELDFEKLPALFNADFTNLPGAKGRAPVSGPTCKALLFTLWCVEGERITFEGIAARVGIGTSTVARALRALEHHGVIRRFTEPAQRQPTRLCGLANVYRVNLERLRAFTTTEATHRRKTLRSNRGANFRRTNPNRPTGNAFKRTPR